MADSDRDSAQNSPKGNLPSRERERTWGQWKRKTFERWKEGLDDVFGGRPPRSAIWKEVSAIRDVLHRSVESTDTQSDTQGKFVHAYLVLPSSGDSQVHGAIRHSEPDCFLVNDSPRIQSGYVLKPKTLKFESPGGDLHHSYFWLNTASLKPSGVHSEDYYEGRNRERLCEVPGGQYVRIERWEEKMWTNDRGERAYSRRLAAGYSVFPGGPPFDLLQKQPIQALEPRRSGLESREWIPCRCRGGGLSFVHVGLRRPRRGLEQALSTTARHTV